METVSYKRQDATALITLQCPNVANAQNQRMTYEIDEAFEHFSQDDAAMVAILRGAGKHFSAGHDTSADVDFDARYGPKATLWWDHRDHNR